ncbi:hypothetical protein BVRB_9g209870 [Beta vulgaris subsp. vulgaris]|nr:hypothetical protein BVRB_9g209870 [Beta vulgaris subsp. vulgaris]
MQEMGICSAAYETQSKKGTKRKCRSKEDDIENDEMERDDDAEYDPEMEDKGEMEEDKSEMEEDKGEMEEDKGEEETDTTTRTASEILFSLTARPYHFDLKEHTANKSNSFITYEQNTVAAI